MRWFTAILVICVLNGAFAQEKRPAKAMVTLLFGGNVSGNITFTQTSCNEAVLIEALIVGLTPGLHGFHVHEKGDLSGGCASSGGHYNPDKVSHGARDNQVRHVGDFGNVMADKDGVVDTKFSDTVVTLFGSRSIIGRTVVLHAGEDDLGLVDNAESRKTGNAGARLACGIIGIVEPFEADWPQCNTSSKLAVSTAALILTAVMSILLK